MTDTRMRRFHSAEFKAKVGLEALGGMKTINQIAQECGVHPILVGQWKREIQAQAKSLLDGKRGPQPLPAESAPGRLLWGDREFEDGTQLAQKKVRDQPAMIRRAWIGIHSDLTQKRQCVLAVVKRTTVYVKRQLEMAIEVDEVLKRQIDEEYTRHPFYGRRKMVTHLFHCGHRVNRKRVQRLMRGMFLAGMASGSSTSTAPPHSTRYTATCCVDCLEEALRVQQRSGKPITSVVFTGALKREGIAISMDCRDRAKDNIFVERLRRSVEH